VNRLRRLVDRTLEFLLATLMAAMVIAVLWQVFTRFVLRDPSSMTEELVRFGLIWLGLLGAAYGFGKRYHLAIDLLHRRSGTTTKRRLDLVTHLSVIVFAFWVLIIGGFRLVDLTLAMGQASAALEIERGYIYLALPISGLAMIFYSLMSMLEVLRGHVRS
jgi:TRAP-type C4-dicarboxylate transport system permease small subunit